MIVAVTEHIGQTDAMDSDIHESTWYIDLDKLPADDLYRIILEDAVATGDAEFDYDGVIDYAFCASNPHGTFDHQMPHTAAVWNFPMLVSAHVRLRVPTLDRAVDRTVKIDGYNVTAPGAKITLVIAAERPEAEDGGPAARVSWTREYPGEDATTHESAFYAITD
jgi:hypothetical protein